MPLVYRGLVVAIKKRPNPERDLVQFRADPEWIDQVNEEAQRLGLNLSAFIRLCVNERLERTHPKKKAEGDSGGA